MTRACDICGAHEAMPVASGRDYLLGEDATTFGAVKCAVCGFSFIERIPDDLPRRYSRGYFAAPQAMPPWTARIANILTTREARRLASRVPTASSILEIGPGHGYFLSRLALAYPTARVWGFDITSEARLDAALDSRISLRYARSLPDAAFEEKQFDLIVMRHVLEHVPDLRVFLAEVRRIGSPACTVYVKVPNRASWAARAFGSYWYGLDFPRHLSYFRPEDLSRLLNDGGFTVTVSGHETDAVDWIGSIRFWLTGHGLSCGTSRLPSLILLAVRAALLPLAALARLCRASSRIWVLARRAET